MVALYTWWFYVKRFYIIRYTSCWVWEVDWLIKYRQGALLVQISFTIAALLIAPPMTYIHIHPPPLSLLLLFRLIVGGWIWLVYTQNFSPDSHDFVVNMRKCGQLSFLLDYKKGMSSHINFDSFLNESYLQVDQ